MNDTPSTIHTTFCLESGLSCNFKVWERAFHDYIEHGFTADDLTIVLRYLRRENKRMNGAAFSLRPDKIFDFEYMRFDSLLAEAKAHERNRRKAQTASEKIMQAYEKSIDPEQSSLLKLNGGRHVSELLKTPAQ